MSVVKSLVAIGIAGLGIGWLVGLSTTPVVAAVIATLLAAAAALAGGSTAGESGAGVLVGRVAPVPLAVLVIGIAIGATGGLGSRVAGWFDVQPAPAKETDLEGILARWEAVGADRADVVKRLLDREFPTDSGARESGAASSPAVPAGLVADALPGGACGELALVEPDAILSTLAASTNKDVRELALEAIRLKVPESFAIHLRNVLCPRK